MLANWLGYQLVMHGPGRITCSANNAIGRWCLQHAGAWAYPEQAWSNTRHDGKDGAA
jgi:hypothetical protein